MFDLISGSRLVVGIVVLFMGAFLSVRGSQDVPRTHFSPSPVLLSVRKSKVSAAVEKVSLRDFVQSKLPSIRSPFVPAWWLFNGHLQTIYSVLGDFSKIDNVVYHRRYLRLMDGGTLGLDFTPATDDDFIPETPVIVVMHGLTGGSHESYVRAILASACAAVEQGGLGYRGVVVNFRGCAGTPVTSPRLYSGGHTDDLRQALFFLSTLFPKAPLLGIGYSLGANVLTRYLAEEGENSRLMSGCVLGCPWDLKKNNDALLASFVGRFVYSKGMGRNLQKLLERNAAGLTQDPDTLMAKRVAATLAIKNPRLDEWDHSITRFVGGTFPPFPFNSGVDYYIWASSHKVVGDIRVPFLIINSADDPIVRSIPENTAGNGFVAMIVTSGGGHLGWFETSHRMCEVRRWIKKPVLEWLQAVGEDVIYEGGRGLSLHEVDGFLKEVGRDDLGCKEMDDEPAYVSTKGQEGLLSGL